MGGGGWLLTSFFSIIYILGLVCYKHTIHVLGEHNGTKTELYRTNTKSQGLVPAYFDNYYCCACSKTSISINKYMQKTGEPENDAGFLKVIIIAAVHVAS